MRIFEAIGEFFLAIFRGIGAAICWLASMAIRYFMVYLPVLVMAGFAIFWILNPDGPDIETFTTMDLLENYDYKFTVMCAEWLTNNPEMKGLISFVLICAFFVIKLALLVIVAILETSFVYILFGLVGTFIIVILFFVVTIAIFFILPGGAVVYSGIFIRYSEYEDRWFYILCTLLTLACSVTCYIYAFAALD